MGLNKLSQADVVEVLSQVPTLLRQAAVLSEENQLLREKVASYEQAEQAEALIYRMEERGFGDNVEGKTVKDKVANLLRSGKDLRVVGEAIDMVPSSGSPFDVSDGPGGKGGNGDVEAFVPGERH